MSDADDANREVGAEQVLEAQEEERLEKRRDEKLAGQAAELNARQRQLQESIEGSKDRQQKASQAVDEIIRAHKKDIADLRSKLRKRAGVLTIVGAVVGVALIWGASQTAGFGSLLMNALGTGLIFASTVAVAAYFVSGYWKAATEAPSNLIYLELQEVHRDLVHVKSAVDSYVNRPERDLIRNLVIEETGKRQDEAEARRESDRELSSRVRQSGLLLRRVGRRIRPDNS